MILKHSSVFSPSELRKQIRTRRRALPNWERHQASQALAKRVVSLRIFATAERIAGYLACDGEMDPAPLLERAWEMQKAVYLPVLVGSPHNHLMFAPYSPDGTMKPNRFGIPEPDVSADTWLPPQQLDLALTPLVAFDANGTRLGMGGGFYDRTFAFLRNPGHLPKPRLLGLAYELQKVEKLPRQPWDVPVDGIVTETALYPGETDIFLE